MLLARMLAGALRERPGSQATVIADGAPLLALALLGVRVEGSRAG